MFYILPLLSRLLLAQQEFYTVSSGEGLVSLQWRNEIQGGAITKTPSSQMSTFYSNKLQPTHELLLS